MKKNIALPIGTIFILLVIALALVGVGYAFWSETLTISGTVHTGDVDVRFSDHGVAECVDTQSGPCQVELAEKDAATTCVVAWGGPDNDSNGDSGSDQMAVTVTGMYPGYHCKVSFDVTSTGTVPVHVELPKPVGVFPVWVDAVPAICYANNVQLEKDQSTVLCTLDIHFTNAQAPAENSGAITFGWTILAKQWNEEPPILVIGNVQHVADTGWFGWSCPAEYPNVVGGGVSKTNIAPFALPDFPIYFVLAMPGATLDGSTYPVFPHYTYPAGNTGIAVHNGGTAQTVYPYIYCGK